MPFAQIAEGKALGLDAPPSMISRADRIIE